MPRPPCVMSWVQPLGGHLATKMELWGMSLDIESSHSPSAIWELSKRIPSVNKWNLTRCQSWQYHTLGLSILQHCEQCVSTISKPPKLLFQKPGWCKTAQSRVHLHTVLPQSFSYVTFYIRRHKQQYSLTRLDAVGCLLYRTPRCSDMPFVCKAWLRPSNLPLCSIHT